jgi:hypothetical protein
MTSGRIKMGTPTIAHTPAIVALLQSPAVQRIRLTAESVSVTGHGYGRVADALSNGRITVEDEVTMPYGYDAVYLAIRNVLVVKPTINLAQVGPRALVLHEMTHALIDLMHLSKSRGLHETENEGIAYIAQLLYIYFSVGNTANIQHNKNLRWVRVADRLRVWTQLIQ